MSVDPGMTGPRSSEASRPVAIGEENTVLTTPSLLLCGILFTVKVNL
jgi:hypothetical protein